MRGTELFLSLLKRCCDRPATEDPACHADQNSCNSARRANCYHSLKSLATGPDGTQTRLEPLTLESLLDASDTRIVALKIDFRENEIAVTALQTTTFDRHTHHFVNFPVEVKPTKRLRWMRGGRRSMRELRWQLRRKLC